MSRGGGTIPITVSIRSEYLDHLDEMAGPRGRSRFFNRLIEQEIGRRALREEAVKKHQPRQKGSSK